MRLLVTRPRDDAEAFATALRGVWGDPSRAPALDLRAMTYWLALGDGFAILPRIARYNLERAWYADRWRPILGHTKVPISVVWGDRDPIAVLEIGQRLADMSGGPLTILAGVGHFPQVEAPAEWTDAVLAALAGAT
jgi:pimeloyl-ACP methyl ester carboxylesterase